MNTLTKLAVIAAATALTPVAANAATLVVDVSGAQGFGAFDSGAGNTILTFNIGANSLITDVAYDVNITAFSPSWLSEATLAFTSSDTSLGDGVFLTPGFDTDAPGTASYSDSANLEDLGLAFAVGADGILRLEFFETFNDGAVSPDSRWNSGTITFTYEAIDVPGAIPEPGSWAMMIAGFGLVGGAMRRRTTTTSVTFA